MSEVKWEEAANLNRPILVAAFEGCELLALGHEEADVAAPAAVSAALSSFAPDCVVSTAAFHDVDRCEEESERAFAVNALGAWHVARVSAELDAHFIFLSTDYVFAGDKGAPYVESDRAAPLQRTAVSGTPRISTTTASTI